MKRAMIAVMTVLAGLGAVGCVGSNLWSGIDTSVSAVGTYLTVKGLAGIIPTIQQLLGGLGT